MSPVIVNFAKLCFQLLKWPWILLKRRASIHLNDDTDYALERDDHNRQAALLRGRPHTVPAYYVSIVNVM